ncbi:hypothetical protein NIES267_71290 (plasmid) [Calothrix parasitica NIES-267]|uniref:Uncharacterized protein n=1 Tax=Calothrix parasitica NIES-267 TaxID=1973488 RepID=A0A1Z4M2C2_9CYAN|nr:hypothetical protein NIES267_71290 [Calothrix parasitica NIES-267]
MDDYAELSDPRGINVDEVLQLKILANNNCSTAREAILGFDRVQTNVSNGGVVNRNNQYRNGESRFGCKPFPVRFCGF